MLCIFSHCVSRNDIKSCSFHQESNEMLQKSCLSGRHCWSDTPQWRNVFENVFLNNRCFLKIVQKLIN